MTLFYAAASPFARKVLAVVHELNLHDRLTLVPATASPVEKNAAIASHNPSGKIPTLVTHQGEAIYDSRVICEYLDGLEGGGKMFPPGEGRWKALVLQSLCDEALDALILCRYETVLRPANRRWPEWLEGQMSKVSNTLDWLEKDWPRYLGGHVNIGVLAAGCLLGYLDFRFANFDWRSERPKLKAWFEGISRRPSMLQTEPKA